MLRDGVGHEPQQEWHAVGNIGKGVIISRQPMSMKAVPEGALQSVLGVGQQAEVWGDQLEAGEAQQAVEVQEGHAPPPRQPPQLPAEPCDVHHRLHLQ